MNRTLYVPRRATLRRWLVGAPSYILDVFDDPGEGDRYTIMLTTDMSSVADGTYSGTWISYVGCDKHGASFWGEMKAHEAVGYRQRMANSHRRTRWVDLPECVRRQVELRVNDGQTDKAA